MVEDIRRSPCMAAIIIRRVRGDLEVVAAGRRIGVRQLRVRRLGAGEAPLARAVSVLAARQGFNATAPRAIWPPAVATLARPPE